MGREKRRGRKPRLENLVGRVQAGVRLVGWLLGGLALVQSFATVVLNLSEEHDRTTFWNMHPRHLHEVCVRPRRSGCQSQHIWVLNPDCIVLWANVYVPSFAVYLYWFCIHCVVQVVIDAGAPTNGASNCEAKG